MTRGDKALAFAASYIIHADLERAAVAAGYSGDSARLVRMAESLLDHPDVRQILRELNRKDVLVAKAKEIAARDVGTEDDLLTRDGLMRWLADAVRGKHTEEHVDKDGCVHEAMPSLTARTGAARLLAQMNGYLVQKVELNHTGEVMHFVMPDNGRGALAPILAVETTAMLVEHGEERDEEED